MKRRKVIYVSVLVAGFLMLGFSGNADNDLFLRINKGIDVFGKVYKEIAVNYVDDVDPDRFIRAGIDGMLKTLDPYTVYIGEKESDELDLVTTGKYGGVGITIGNRDGMITVIGLMEGFSAVRQGIEVGDRIVEVDGKRVVGSSLEDIRQLVRGAPGTEVKMKIEREGAIEPLEFALMREEIPVRNVTYAGYVEKGLGYVRLERFSRTAGDDLRNALKDLRVTGELKGMVLDLRDNPGGLLDIAVETSAKFLAESSLVVSTRGRRGDADRKYYSAEKPMLVDVPLVVLVNRGTASASEIVSGAIQDLDRGVIVGSRTFGKGLVQTITRLSDNSSLKITTARYYTPSGRCIQEIDYSHRTREGNVVTFADSLKREFRTTHNRKVLEGGGIQPDSVVTEEEDNRFISELYRKSMLFKYANKYATEHKNLAENFQVTPEILSDFEKFLEEKKFDFQEEVELRLKELREAAEKSRFGSAFFDEAKKVDGIIAAEKNRMMDRYRNELKSVLRTEIIGRIKGEKARIESSFGDDRQLQVAMTLLKSKKMYERLLAGKNK